MPRRFVDYLQKNLQAVTLVEVPETRHLVAMEKPREFNHLVIDFLTRPCVRLPEGWHTITAS